MSLQLIADLYEDVSEAEHAPVHTQKKRVLSEKAKEAARLRDAREYQENRDKILKRLKEKYQENPAKYASQARERYHAVYKHDPDYMDRRRKAYQRYYSKRKSLKRKQAEKAEAALDKAEQKGDETDSYEEYVPDSMQKSKRLRRFLL